ncbi:MAG: NAD(P)-binding domain-containing protein [Planctomycetota bacterium]
MPTDLQSGEPPAPTTPPANTEVLIIGGGPAGVEAALAAVDHGYETVLLETQRVGATIERWSQVRLFSPWALNRSRRGLAVLEQCRDADGEPVEVPPEDEYPTGRDYIDHYLRPLSESDTLKPRIYEEVRVVSVARRDALKGDLIGDPRRGDGPFRVLWESGENEGYTESRIVIDASGVYAHPNWTGTGGGPALGERAAESWIRREIPDPLGNHRDRYSGKSILVVGGGYSAATCIRDLVHLGRETTRTFVDWVVRAPDGKMPLIQHDSLPERRSLSETVNALVDDPPPFLRVWPGCVVDAFGEHEVAVRRLDNDQTERLFVDEVISLTGFHPDAGPLAELQVHHCYATDGLMKVSASLLSQDGGGDCLAVESASSETLRNPEPGLFVIGAKSYGRSSQYLLRTGMEQVEAIFDELLPPPCCP